MVHDKVLLSFVAILELERSKKRATGTSRTKTITFIKELVPSQPGQQ